MTYDLYSKFDIELHKANYVHYLEVIIDRDGVVHYAVPSHQEYLIAECMKKYSWTRQELSDACPQEYYGDFTVWLCKMCDCVSVWENFLQFWEINDAQFKTLRELQGAGLYVGELPDRPMSMEEYRQIKITQYEAMEDVWYG